MVDFHSQNFWKGPFFVKEVLAILYLRLWFFDCCMHVAQKIVPEEQTQAALIDLNNVFPWSSTHRNQLSITCDYMKSPGLERLHSVHCVIIYHIKQEYLLC